jgi:hypothetical protein
MHEGLQCKTEREPVDDESLGWASGKARDAQVRARAGYASCVISVGREGAKIPLDL